MKILIANDNSFETEGIKKILKEQENTDVFSVDSIDNIINAQPDILVMDITFIKNRAEQIKKLDYFNFKTIIIINSNQEILCDSVFAKLKISACLLKTTSVTELIHAVNKIVANNCYITSTLKNYLFIANIKDKAYLKIHTKQNARCLTAREVEVLQMIATGKSNIQIAEDLFLSEKTVKNHLTSIFKKLKVTDRTQALIYALKNNIVSLT